jgi:hypothetical protein
VTILSEFPPFCGDILINPPAVSGKSGISGYSRHGRSAVFRRNFAEYSGFRLFLLNLAAPIFFI